jgi:hypothetical protein
MREPPSPTPGRETELHRREQATQEALGQEGASFMCHILPSCCVIVVVTNEARSA